MSGRITAERPSLADFLSADDQRTEEERAVAAVVRMLAEDRALPNIAPWFDGGRDWGVLVLHDLPTGATDDLPRFLDRVLDRGIEIEQNFRAECIPVEGGFVTSAAAPILPVAAG